MARDVRMGIVEAAYGCVVRRGIGATSLEEVARAAGVSRATLYRYFPGGRDEVIGAVVSWQTLSFFEVLAQAVAGAPDLETLLVEGLLAAHRAVEEHAVLQRLLATEPQLLVPQLTVESPQIGAMLKGFFLARFAGHRLRAGLEHAEAADYVARLVLSFIGSPGRWDLDDRDQVRELVRSEIMAGLVAPGEPFELSAS